MSSGLKEWIVRRMAASHMAGPELPDAMRVYQCAMRYGWSCAFGYWYGPNDTPESTVHAYNAALDVIERESLRCYLSIKAPAIEFDPGLLKELLDRGQKAGVRIHLDAMDPGTRLRTFALIEDALKEYRNIGCTLPSRWSASVGDAERVIEYGIPVRIVKGQWSDPDKPNGIDPRKNFLTIARVFAGKAVSVAVATHDRPLAVEAVRILKQSSTCCEIEQLSSLPQNCAVLAQKFSLPFRIYVPYGYPSLPYDIWQTRTRPAIMAWALRDFIQGRHRALATGKGKISPA